jgi:hypothetical protein
VSPWPFFLSCGTPHLEHVLFFVDFGNPFSFFCGRLR